MSKLLVQERQEKELSRLQSVLTREQKGSAGKSISLTKKEAHSIATLLAKILTERPLVVDSYITPNEAAKLAGVSRPVIIEMLKNGGLRGHMVKSHWRVQKESLLDYINGRDQTFKSMAAIDADGFGIDK
jgi:excisionase family DNA binding protein